MFSCIFHFSSPLFTFDRNVGGVDVKGLQNQQKSWNHSHQTLYIIEIFNMKFTFNECITNVWQWEFSNSVIFRLCPEVTCLELETHTHTHTCLTYSYPTHTYKHILTHICIKVYICTRINTTYNYEDT